MGRPNFYKILEHPLVYTVAINLLAPAGKFLIRKHYENAFCNTRGLVLDVGCGPQLLTPAPVEGTVVGIDVNFDYVSKFCQEGHHSRTSRLGLVSSAAPLSFGDDLFDECRCNAVLHHLPDEFAKEAVMEMVRVTKPGGRVVIFDPVYPKTPYRRPLAWMTCKFDRGEWVRTEQAQQRLLNEAYPFDWDVTRFTYTLSGLEGVIFSAKKVAAV